VARILVIEDEEHLATGIKFNLELEDYEVETVADGGEALERLTQAPAAHARFDLLILDVMLPGLDGFELARRLRAAGDYTPILMLTAKARPQDVVGGLESGADDYLAKPFDLPVLLARVKGLLRRREWTRGEDGRTAAPVRIGQAEVDFAGLQLSAGGETTRLTLLEATLLKYLLQNAGRVVSKGEILENVWNVSPEVETRAVDNFIVRLRRYVEPAPRFPRVLLTVRGAGYKLVLP
jgi:DNA-binding response OmpR family regulator